VEAAVADYAGDDRASRPGEADEAEQETNDRAKLLSWRLHEPGACDPKKRPEAHDVYERDNDAYVADGIVRRTPVSASVGTTQARP
jgi:hypothetical protein